MAHQHPIITSPPAQTRFRRKSAPSDQSRVDFLSRFYTPPTDRHYQLSSTPSRNLQYPYQYECYSPDEGSNRSKLNNTCYPSPLLTYPRCGNHTALPPPTDLDSPQPNLVHQSDAFGGVLDSPLVMYHSLLKSQAPISPPLTLPTSTLCLPLAEPEDYISSTVDDAHDLLDQEDITDFRSPHLDALTPSSRSSCSTLQSSPPLSPVSPDTTEWCPHNFGYSAADQLPTSGIFPGDSGDGLPLSYYDFDDDLLRDERGNKPRVPSPDNPGLSLLNIQVPQPCPDYDQQPLFTKFISDSPKSLFQDLDPIYLDDNLLAPPFSSIDHTPGNQNLYLEQITPHRTHHIQQINQPSLIRSETPKGERLPGPAPFSHICSPITRISNLPELDDVYDMDLDSRSFSPPCSPSLRISTALPEDDQWTVEEPSLSFYPDSTKDVLNDTVMLSPPGSPALTVLSLPGADIDEDLIPVDLAPTKSPSAHASPLYPNRLLGLDDDSTPPSCSDLRSPSPEPCVMLDMSLLAPQIPEDKELKTLCGLMKRMKDKERAARQLESLIEEEESVTRSISGGNSPAAVDAWNKLVDARRKTRRLRQKVREVGTLLRVKLAQRGWKIGKDIMGKPILIPTSPKKPVSITRSLDNFEDAMKVDFPLQSSKQPRITNPQQLLAKMVMDRHEPKYNPSLRAGLPLNRRPTSPLSRASLLAFDLDPTHNKREDDLTSESAPLSDVSMNNLDGKMSGLLQDLDLGMMASNVP